MEKQDIKNVFILRIEEYKAPERKLLVEECYQSRTKAIDVMKKYWEKEKKKYLKEYNWRTEEEFDNNLTSDGGYISYGWGGKTIYFKLTRLKIM